MQTGFTSTLKVDVVLHQARKYGVEVEERINKRNMLVGEANDKQPSSSLTL